LEPPTTGNSTALTSVDLDISGDVWVICTMDSDPSEEHLVESASAAKSHELHLYGLAENSDYTCEVRPSCEGALSEGFDIRTQNIGNHDGWTVTRDPIGVMYGTYTLFNDGPACAPNPLNRLFIIDPEGRVRWSYSVGNEFLIDLDASYIGDGVVHVGGGWGLFQESEPHRGVIRQVDLSGNVLLERTSPDFGLGFNHHSEVLDSGEILSLTTSRDTDGNRSWYGVAIEQWDPSTEDVTWSWSSQQLYDNGTFGTQYDDSPWHANSVTLHDDALGAAAWISLYYGQMIWRVDRNTGELTHRFGPGGDFALFDTQGSPLGPSEFPYGQHDPDYTDDNRILLYDNGVDRPGGSFTRVAEYEVDLTANTATLLWTWTEPGWYDPVIGDADYLPNGNVLVTRGHVWCYAFNNGDSGLIELDPVNHRPLWRLDYHSGSNAIFRAERYGGCEMFANGKYCPAVADRIAQLR
jgi:hypothetical protein